MGMLPTKKTPPKLNPADLTVLLYGKPKLGKSTMCSQAEDAIFLATEPGLNHLDVYQAPITSWQQLLDAAAEIAKGDHPFRTLVLDTVDNAYRFCHEHVCSKNGIRKKVIGSGFVAFCLATSSGESWLVHQPFTLPGGNAPWVVA